MNDNTTWLKDMTDSALDAQTRRAAALFAAFYRGLLDEGIPRPDALEMAKAYLIALATAGMKQAGDAGRDGQQ